ncbi:hypothetical protein EES39_28320 [Streptomyces sp. ADI92-24]|nr:hypothetical protein EES39_28320 [Streptomyces sp. ADI92-24]
MHLSRSPRRRTAAWAATALTVNRPADRSAVAIAEPDDAWCLPYSLATPALVRIRTGAPSNAAALLDRAEVRGGDDGPAGLP